MLKIEEPELPPTIHKIEGEKVEYELHANGEKLQVLWDGFCLTVESEKFAFVASVNDPTISPIGNVAVIFGTADEIAQRITDDS